MGSLQNLGNRGSNAAQQLAAQLSRSGGSSNPSVHAHQQGMLGGGGVGSGSSWGTGKHDREIRPIKKSALYFNLANRAKLLTI